MSKIKLIEKDTNISELNMVKMPWDVEIDGVSYQVVAIENYYHPIIDCNYEKLDMDCYYKKNNLWMYPKNSEPTCYNLVEYNCDKYGVCWGIRYEPHNYIGKEYSNQNNKCFTSNKITITRNGKDFYSYNSSLDKLEEFYKKLNEHPLNLNEYNFEKNIVGRRINLNNCVKGTIAKWIGGDKAIILVRPYNTECIDFFNEEEIEYLYNNETGENEKCIKLSIFDYLLEYGE